MSIKNNLKFENDPDNIISDTVNLLYQSTEILSDKLSDELLANLWDKTNFRDVDLDKDFLGELIFNVHSCYKTIKDFYLYNIESDSYSDLSDREFNRFVLRWNILLGIERMRREGMIEVEPFKILDFDEMDDIRMNIKFDETLLQSLLN